jgi:hypothetical protein
MQASLTRNRDLDRGNAQPSSLGSDFERLGFRLWPVLAARYKRTNSWNRGLEALNLARNGIAHSDVAKIQDAARRGFPMRLATMKRWQGLLTAWLAQWML